MGKPPHQAASSGTRAGASEREAMQNKAANQPSPQQARTAGGPDVFPESAPHLPPDRVEPDRVEGVAKQARHMLDANRSSIDGGSLEPRPPFGDISASVINAAQGGQAGRGLRKHRRPSSIPATGSPAAESERAQAPTLMGEAPCPPAGTEGWAGPPQHMGTAHCGVIFENQGSVATAGAGQEGSATEGLPPLHDSPEGPSAGPAVGGGTQRTGVMNASEVDNPAHALSDGPQGHAAIPAVRETVVRETPQGAVAVSVCSSANLRDSEGAARAVRGVSEDGDQERIESWAGLLGPSSSAGRVDSRQELSGRTDSSFVPPTPSSSPTPSSNLLTPLPASSGTQDTVCLPEMQPVRPPDSFSDRAGGQHVLNVLRETHGAAASSFPADSRLSWIGSSERSHAVVKNADLQSPSTLRNGGRGMAEEEPERRKGGAVTKGAAPKTRRERACIVEPPELVVRAAASRLAEPSLEVGLPPGLQQGALIGSEVPKEKQFQPFRASISVPPAPVVASPSGIVEQGSPTFSSATKRAKAATAVGVQPHVSTNAYVSSSTAGMDSTPIHVEAHRGVKALLQDNKLEGMEPRLPAPLLLEPSQEESAEAVQSSARDGRALEHDPVSTPAEWGQLVSEESTASRCRSGPPSTEPVEGRHAAYPEGFPPEGDLAFVIEEKPPEGAPLSSRTPSQGETTGSARRRGLILSESEQRELQEALAEEEEALSTARHVPWDQSSLIGESPGSSRDTDGGSLWEEASQLTSPNLKGPVPSGSPGPLGVLGMDDSDRVEAASPKASFGPAAHEGVEQVAHPRLSKLAPISTEIPVAEMRQRCSSPELALEVQPGPLEQGHWASASADFGVGFMNVLRGGFPRSPPADGRRGIRGVSEVCSRTTFIASSETFSDVQKAYEIEVPLRRLWKLSD